MPKIVSQEERALTKQAIYEKTVQLIKQKGMRAITVDDIVGAVGISKGAFYTYFPSKEICLYEVILQYEKNIFSKIEATITSVYSEKDKVVFLLSELFISEDSLMTSISPMDKEILLRKLPAEYHEKEKEKSEDHFQKVLLLMKLDHQQMEVVALLVDCLSFMASNKDYSRTGTKEAQDVLINTISDFVMSAKNRDTENE